MLLLIQGVMTLYWYREMEFSRSECVRVSFNAAVTLSVLTNYLPLRHNINHKQDVFHWCSCNIITTAVCILESQY